MSMHDMADAALARLRRQRRDIDLIRSKERHQVLIQVAEVFETRKDSEAMLCSQVAAYCREQAALSISKDQELTEIGEGAAAEVRGEERERQRVHKGLESLIAESELCECEPGDLGFGTVRCAFHRLVDDLLDTLKKMT